MANSQLSPGLIEIIGRSFVAYDIAYIHNAVFKRMQSFNNLWQLLGGRAYLNNLPQKPEYPALVFTQVYCHHIHDYEGKGDLAGTQFQFDVLGPNYNKLAVIAEQLRMCFMGLSGTYAGVKIYGSRTLNDYAEPYEPSAELQRIMLEFEIWHDEISP